MPREAVAFLMFVTMVGGFVLLYPLVRALAERLRPRPETGKEELQALREDVVQELQQNGYRWPTFTSYNGAGIPFAYSPLAFYVTGLASDITRIELIEIFRFCSSGSKSVVAVAWSGEPMRATEPEANSIASASAVLPSCE